MVTRKELKLSNQINQAVVDGILNGYSSYLEERTLKEEELRISDGYAWVKGNHLDHYVSIEGEKAGINYVKAKAGKAWGYFQFEMNHNGDKCLAIVKQIYRANDTLLELEKKQEDDRENNYLYGLMQNNSSLELHKLKRKFDNKEHALPAESYEEIKAVMKQETLKIETEYDRFYMFLYEIDSFSKNIGQIKLVMPDPKKFDLLEIEDLTILIDSSEYRISANLLKSAPSEAKEFVASQNYRINQIDDEEIERESQG